MTNWHSLTRIVLLFVCSGNFPAFCVSRIVYKLASFTPGSSKKVLLPVSSVWLHPGSRGPLRKLGQKLKRGSQIEPYRLFHSFNGLPFTILIHFRSDKARRKPFGGPFLVLVSIFLKILVWNPIALASGYNPQEPTTPTWVWCWPAPPSTLLCAFGMLSVARVCTAWRGDTPS